MELIQKSKSIHLGVRLTLKSVWKYLFTLYLFMFYQLLLTYKHALRV